MFPALSSGSLSVPRHRRAFPSPELGPGSERGLELELPSALPTSSGDSNRAAGSRSGRLADDVRSMVSNVTRATLTEMAGTPDADPNGATKEMQPPHIVGSVVTGPGISSHGTVVVSSIRGRQCSSEELPAPASSDEARGYRELAHQLGAKRPREGAHQQAGATQ